MAGRQPTNEVVSQLRQVMYHADDTYESFMQRIADVKNEELRAELRKQWQSLSNEQLVYLVRDCQISLMELSQYFLVPHRTVFTRMRRVEKYTDTYIPTMHIYASENSRSRGYRLSKERIVYCHSIGLTIPEISLVMACAENNIKRHLKRLNLI